MEVTIHPPQERILKRTTRRQVHLDSRSQERPNLICIDGSSSDKVLDGRCPALHGFGSGRCLSIGTESVEGTPGGLSGSALPARTTVSLPPDAGDASSLLYITAVLTLQHSSWETLLITPHIGIFGTLPFRTTIAAAHLLSFPAQPTSLPTPGSMASETINFGQIFAVAVVGFLLYRWFSGPSPPSSQSSGRNGGRQVNPEHVEAVAQMYPQLDRRAIIWDLHRNGGSVQATVERLLGGRSLETVSSNLSP